MEGVNKLLKHRRMGSSASGTCRRIVVTNKSLRLHLCARFFGQSPSSG